MKVKTFYGVFGTNARYETFEDAETEAKRIVKDHHLEGTFVIKSVARYIPAKDVIRKFTTEEEIK